MTTFELFTELLKKPKEEIEYTLTGLLLKDKMDFINVSNAYAQTLKIQRDDNLSKLVEAESCVLGHFVYSGTEDDLNQRCLYLLNESKRFNMDSLNKKYNYNKEKGKSLSIYEQQKL